MEREEDGFTDLAPALSAWLRPVSPEAAPTRHATTTSKAGRIAGLECDATNAGATRGDGAIAMSDYESEFGGRNSADIRSQDK